MTSIIIDNVSCFLKCIQYKIIFSGACIFIRLTIVYPRNLATLKMLPHSSLLKLRVSISIDANFEI